MIVSTFMHLVINMEKRIRLDLQSHNGKPIGCNLVTTIGRFVASLTS
jgi:hypothetical protein